jgi:hypothetical protein
MPSIHALYNQEVLEGHREALAALRELLATEPDRTERRRLATAILKTRKVEDPNAPQAERPIRLRAAANRGPTGKEGDQRPPTSDAAALHSEIPEDQVEPAPHITPLTPPLLLRTNPDPFDLAPPLSPHHVRSDQSP